MQPTTTTTAQAEAQSQSQSYRTKALLGGFASVCMEGFLHPLDTIRTRMKMNTSTYMSFFGQIKQMYREEGIKSYFRGNSCTVSGAFVGNIIYFYCYEYLKDTFTHKGTFSRDLSPFVAAFIGGVLCDLFYLPFDVVRVRMQIEPGTYNYKNVVDGVTQMLKKEGLTSIKECGVVYFALSGALTSLTFGFYELFSRLMKPAFPKTKDVNLPLTITSSILASGLSAYVANPLEVMLTRKQAHPTPISSIELAKTIYKTEGLKGFMKGVHGTALYYVCSYVILLPTYEILKSVFNVDLSDD